MQLKFNQKSGTEKWRPNKGQRALLSFTFLKTPFKTRTSTNQELQKHSFVWSVSLLFD